MYTGFIYLPIPFPTPHRPNIISNIPIDRNIMSAKKRTNIIILFI